MTKKAGLIILDGWGIGDQSLSDAIFNANTPVMDNLLKTYPNTKLQACGEEVGLPKGQMGNSEVGHLNIGAGRVVYQELSRINRSISQGDFFQNQTLLDAFSYAKTGGHAIHLLGLVSHGGVHSSMEHLEALIALCQQQNASKVFIHAITDGRDCDPKSAEKDIQKLIVLLNENIQISSIIGRYYAMDRDKRWERISLAYQLFVNGVGEKFNDANEAIQHNYQKGITDEFILPIILNKEGTIKEGDVVISFNFRTDRPREITQVLTQSSVDGYNMKPLSLYYVTMTPYDESFKNIQVVFEKENLKGTIGEALSHAGLKQLRIAETEKYPHVTFFFNGGRETPFENENRILVNSPKVATYDLQPEMSAHEVKQQLIAYVEKEVPDFFCLNFANPDMVGHTGNYDAIRKAVEVVDECLGKILNSLSHLDYSFLIIADHGNADFAINADGSPNTAHSLNQVPCIFVSPNPASKLKEGILADVAPTLLEIIGIALPKEMTGKSLIKKGA